MFKNWVDNRDIRDRYYLGPLIIPYDETDTRHKLIVGEIGESEAMGVITEILVMDLEHLESLAEKEKVFLKEKKAADPEYTFNKFYTDQFYSIVSKMLKEGAQIELPGYFKFLDKEELKRIIGIQGLEIYGKYSMFNPDHHVSYVQRLFEDVYYKRRDLPWFWDRGAVRHPIYKDLEQLERAIVNCKKRLEEIELVKV